MLEEKMISDIIIIITIKKVKRGNARYRNGEYRITIPQWAMNRSEEYGIYYICHELAHVTHFLWSESWNHNAQFKMIEDVYLADFGISIKRKRAYPGMLTTFGQVVYYDN